MTSAAVCAEGFCKKRKKDLQLCAQKPAAVCAAIKKGRNLQLGAQINCGF